MNTIEIINKKRNGITLTKEEISDMVMGYVKEEIPDYQMSAFLMSICINGMNEEEIFALTDVMLHSGEIFDASDFGSNIVDKHSTGGVGDKTTLVLAPLVASIGVNVMKMSGRGLGFTGGTIDKLESISGFKTSLTEEEIRKQMEDIHVCIASGNRQLVPADKKMYALRDVTATVESIPLIASSIMSKKLALGSKKIVIDVKVGQGALMKTEKEARKLASTMINIGKKYGAQVVCVLSDMENPLGFSVGNGLEVKESIDALNGIFAPDFYELVVTLASEMTSLGLEIPIEEAREKVIQNIDNKKGYSVFLELVKMQKGNIDALSISSKFYDIKSDQEGYITSIDALKLAHLSLMLGAGREDLNTQIHHGVGLWLFKKTGDFVKRGERLIRVYFDEKEISKESVLESFQIEKKPKKKTSIVLDILR